MKYLSDEAVKYMNDVWGFSGATECDDMAMFWESEYPEMTAKRLVDAGAVEPNCKEAKEMIRVADSIDHETELQIIKDVIVNYFVLECTSCNTNHFIPKHYNNLSDWLDTRCDGCDKKGFLKESK